MTVEIHNRSQQGKNQKNNKKISILDHLLQSGHVCNPTEHNLLSYQLKILGSR